MRRPLSGVVQCDADVAAGYISVQAECIVGYSRWAVERCGERVVAGSSLL